MKEEHFKKQMTADDSEKRKEIHSKGSFSYFDCVCNGVGWVGVPSQKTMQFGGTLA